ncbi:FlaA1/EpsC-like NDP-sugar epimerase [Ruminiclostridium sufflavum DSM 19573]|uniref:FlaA1/EpsC-like NDP-sugar epimerase n=1 Tax=Ruminiclostridium sufflavum DSM 19573 TaxID=1121337 RepID=A0A318Y6S0_9FIRM|nr:nucleoside-diphosphate sugar epimerase/dehydratase [Ruminiclostridium sufflavum]PYG87787.1 FlaA1/EpsC-like NDP-sugar epimerase [Ruminiclostridium sufflavum DSM 19573]
MKTTNKNIVYLLLDALIVNLALGISMIVKFDAAIPFAYLEKLPFTIILTTAVSIGIYFAFGLYSMLWVYASIEELIKITLATAAGILMQIIIAAYFSMAMPISVYAVSWMLTLILVGGIRVSSRVIKRISVSNSKYPSKKRVMIVGAGEAASIIIKEIKNNKRSIYEPVIAIDDDPSKHKSHINGVPIAGGKERIVRAAAEMAVDEIIIAMPSIGKKKSADFINICKKTGCKLKVLPSVYGLVNGEVSIKKIRDVTFEDLLPRDEIDLSIDEIADYLKDKTILVTGGGGSIGSELCRQIAEYKPGRLLIFDIYENNAYDLQNELLQRYKDSLDIKVVIGSIRDRGRLSYIFSEYKPQIVFHAAAHKHVPLMEESPQEAVKNNIFGTLNLAECANLYGVLKFVQISTDKAVNPTSVMGATKRAAELIIQYMNSVSKTQYCAVRFGNVLGSNGSVIPLFKKQIEYGGPVSITHPDVTRYFMTIPEAASLVIQSGAMMKEGGEIFVLDMGEQVKIIDLAKTLITLSGLKPDIDIEIEYTGLRPGEKLYEELLISKDGVDITKNNKIFIEKARETDLESYIKVIKAYRFNGLEDYNEVIEFIKRLMPSFQVTKSLQA